MSSTSAVDEIDEAKEREYFRRVVDTFKYYRKSSLEHVQKSENVIKTLPKNHQKYLRTYQEYLVKFKNCLNINNHLVNLIIEDVDTLFQNDEQQIDSSEDDIVVTSMNDDDCVVISPQNQHKIHQDVGKVQSILKHIARDWSEIGRPERAQCYTPILSMMERLFPAKQSRAKVKVLVPGAGMGRLAWEIAGRSFTCQGNEFSLFMLFASNFILNCCNEVNKYVMYPWVNQYVNNMSAEDQMLEVRFPDACPLRSKRAQNFSMAAGDFLKVYTESEWTCVVTCFFIDCAPNVLEYIERIHTILLPGGYWINLGPLLYHYSDMPTEVSIEPPYDILKEIIKNIGFEFVKEETHVKTKYAQNPKSMMQQEYDSVFFVCRKP